MIGLFHRHKFIPFRTEIMQLGIIHYATGTTTPTRIATDIYETCRCGEKRIRQMDGEWSMESLGWHLQEATFEQHSGTPRFILSQEPIKGEIGRMVWVKKVGII